MLRIGPGAQNRLELYDIGLNLILMVFALEDAFQKKLSNYQISLSLVTDCWPNDHLLDDINSVLSCGNEK